MGLLNVLVVYAHHEPTSFTSAMKNVVYEALNAKGHKVAISDLYGQGFTPVAQKWDFATSSGRHFNYMLEQRHAANLQMSFSPDIVGELDKLKAADFIIFVTPLWWMSVPAILKGWFDRILAMGVAWDGGKFYENGLMRGKQAMMVVAAGHPAEYYQPSGLHRATVTQMLHPINYGTLAFCGFNVHEPYVATNVLGSDQNVLAQSLKDLQYRIEHFVDSPQWLTFYK